MAQEVSMKTSLYQSHLDAGAKLVDFHGWQLPIHYGSQIDEHHSVRQSAGVFDVSHMTIIDVVGKQAQAFLRTMLSNDIAKLDMSQALYSCLCNEHGGVVDDLIVYKLADTRFRLVVNASTREKDIKWLQAHLHDGVELELPDDKAILAVQGPESEEKLVSALSVLGIHLNVSSLNRFYAVEQSDWFVGRTGYTGEDGFEIILPASKAPMMFAALLTQNVKPCGLGARDTLRLEAGMCLYGQDLDEQYTPVQSGIGWAVDVRDSNRDFIGRNILYEQKATGTAIHQVALVLQQRGIMRAGQPIQCAGANVGVVTSGGFSPTLQQSIALARVEKPVIGGCDVLIRDKLFAADVTSAPFIGKN